MDDLTDGQTDGQTIKTPDAPGGPFRPGHKKYMLKHAFGYHRKEGVTILADFRGDQPSISLAQ